MRNLSFHFIALGALLSTGACAFPVRDCPPAFGEGRAEALRCQAGQGNQSAQYELGMALRTGEFGERDIKSAIRQFKRAAARNSGQTFIYMPPVGNQKYGSVMPFSTGPATPGHLGAKLALAEIYLYGEGGLRPDLRRARRWAERARDQGAPEAVALLARIETLVTETPPRKTGR